MITHQNVDSHSNSHYFIGLSVFFLCLALTGCVADVDEEQALPGFFEATELYADATLQMQVLADGSCRSDVVVQITDDRGEPFSGVSVYGSFPGTDLSETLGITDNRGIAVLAAPAIGHEQDLAFALTAVESSDGVRFSDVWAYDAELAATCNGEAIEVVAQYGIATSPVDGEAAALGSDGCSCHIATSPLVPQCGDCP